MVPWILIAIFNMSIAGSVIIILALVARLFLKRLPKSYSDILWGIVCLRLIIPFGINFYGIINFLKGEKVGNIISRTEYIPQSIGIFFRNDRTPNTSLTTLIMMFLFFIWFMGFIGIALYEIFAYGNARKRLSTAIKIKDNVYETDQISTPFIFGLIHPKIYIPLELTKTELKYVLCHELTHIKRKDYIVKFLECMILAFHWFNPLVWIAFKYMSLDMEMRCDEKVMDNLGDEVRKEYAEIIFNFSKTKIKVTRSMLTFGASDTRIRIGNILNKKKISILEAVIIPIICVVILLGAVSNSVFTSVFENIRHSIYISEIQHLYATDLSNINIDGIQIGTNVEDIDLSSYQSDRPLTRGNYTYYFNHLILDVDSENKVNYIFAVKEAVELSIKGNTNISSIYDITKLLGSNYKNKVHDREQRLQKHIYFDNNSKIAMEFVYAEFDESLIFIVFREIK